VRIHINEAKLRRLVAARAGKASRAAAERVAEAVKAQRIEVGAETGDPDEYPLPVTVSDEPNGEARVTIAHPAGKAVQAKHGVLTRAAASLGLEVRG
jgi:hypothetical protein